jgi:hypothetical protein
LGNARLPFIDQAGQAKKVINVLEGGNDFFDPEWEIQMSHHETENKGFCESL